MPWEQLQAIREQNREYAEIEERRVPEVCPIDGNILDVHPDGRRNCPAGDYEYPRDLPVK